MDKRKTAAAVITATGIIASAALIFNRSSACADGIREGLKLCAATLIPSLFPFLTVSQFTVESGMSDFLGILFSKPAEIIFGLPGVCAPVILMSMIGGFPVGARMTAQLLEKGSITSEQAQRLNLFCINAGPSFIIGTVGGAMLSSARAGTILYVSTVISSLILGVASRLLFRKEKKAAVTKAVVRLRDPVSAFTASVSGSLNSMLSICAWVILFSAVITVLLSFSDSTSACVMSAVIEVTTGTRLLSRRFELPVTAAVLGFGGISVHCQIISYIRKSGLSLRLFLAFRILSAAVSALVCKAAVSIFPCDVSAFSNYSEVFQKAYSVSFPSAAALIIMCILLILEVDTDRKMC